MTQKERLAEYRRSQNPVGAVLSHIQMLQGDKGDTPSDAELLALIRPLLPTAADLLRLIRPLIPAKAQDGHTPTDQELLAIIRPLIPHIEDGKTPTNQELIDLIRPLIPPAIPGEQANPNVVADIVLSQLATGTKLKPEHIEGLPKTLNELITHLRMGGFSGGGSSTASTSATFYSDTIITGAIDGVNTIFTVAHTIATPLALHLANSIYQPTVDFTTSGVTITMVIPPDISLSGQPFWLLHI